jgi:hypothetical protein
MPSVYAALGAVGSLQNGEATILRDGGRHNSQAPNQNLALVGYAVGIVVGQ